MLIFAVSFHSSFRKKVNYLYKIVPLFFDFFRRRMHLRPKVGVF